MIHYTNTDNPIDFPKAEEVDMNERILKLALDAGLLNYVDNETPRRYFVHGHADLEEVERFAKLIVRQTMGYASRNWEHGHLLAEDLKVYFGIKE
jgi:hypothetical protein